MYGKFTSSRNKNDIQQSRICNPGKRHLRGVLVVIATEMAGISKVWVTPLSRISTAISRC